MGLCDTAGTVWFRPDWRNVTFDNTEEEFVFLGLAVDACGDNVGVFVAGVGVKFWRIAGGDDVGKLLGPGAVVGLGGCATFAGLEEAVSGTPAIGFEDVVAAGLASVGAMLVGGMVGVRSSDV